MKKINLNVVCANSFFAHADRLECIITRLYLPTVILSAAKNLNDSDR